MSAERPLVGAVTRAVQQATSVPDLRERVCAAAVAAGYEFACFDPPDDDAVTASSPDVDPPEPEEVTPTYRSASDSPSPPGGDDVDGAPKPLGDDAAAAPPDAGVVWVEFDDDPVAAVPVVDADDWYGTLSFGPVERVEDGAERERLAAVGRVVGEGVARLRTERECEQLRESLRNERRQFEKLHSVAAGMVGCENPKDIYYLAIDAAENILEFDICGIDIEEDGYLVPKATSTGLESGDSRRLPADEGIAGKTYQENSSFVVDDVATHENAEPANSEYTSVLSVPIEDVGVFQAGSQDRGAFTRSDAELVELLMSHVSATLQRLQSADALRESEQKYRTLVEQSHDAVITYADGDLLFANERAAELFARSRETLLEGSPCELFHPEDRVKIERVVGELTAEVGRQQTFEARIQRPDGDVRFCEFSATSITYEDCSAVLASIRDITEWEARQRELERQNERLDEFASVVSHDLRSPINVARGSVDLAREDGGDEHLDRASEALDRMDALVENILDLARQGRLVDETESVQLDEVATAAWQSVDATDASFDVETAASVDADRTRLQELFENLFRNAVEHGSEDGRVEVTVSPCEDGFAVSDDGPGLPEGSHDDVFERGFTSNEEGTGFGLAIVESIADAHDWTVEAVPPGEDDRGARFEITGCRAE